MDINALTQYCLSKKGALEDYPFGDDVLVIKVVSKMFALISDNGDQPKISLKCDPFIAENLRQQHTAITPGYHLNKNHWNTILIDGTIPELEIFKMIDHSYELVFKGLKKSEKESMIQL
ncbi:putative DNA-binding protein (MmcQ/YjbR family) [Paenibacillus sp. DS2015]|uniref:MmcQ/YjbR family DNA-binding protein n=1 Tax=Paenibacillus sp. DS2015 TaxID=3373917 RepID=UPI003D20F46F